MRALFLVALLAGSAHAEPWYRGKHGNNRVLHVTLTAVGATEYLSSVLFLEDALAPAQCRWCTPPGFDVSVRDALVWQDRDGAAMYSNLTAYVALPALALGTTLYSVPGTTGELLDDVMPILEAATLGHVLTQIVKLSVGRQRPYVHFGTPSTGSDANLSFFSGHSALAFSLATSAGLLAHARGYRSEPFVWGAGMTLATATAYLRIAADKHYLSDVVAGGIVGIAGGFVTTRLMCRSDGDLTLVPSKNGVALVGIF